MAKISKNEEREPVDETRISNLVAQARPGRRAFALMPESSYAKVSGPVFSSADVEFDFMVNGVRRMSKDRKAIVENTVFVPRNADDDSLTKIKQPEAIRRLKATGILDEDGTVNIETVEKLDAYKRMHKRQ